MARQTPDGRQTDATRTTTPADDAEAAVSTAVATARNKADAFSLREILAALDSMFPRTTGFISGIIATLAAVYAPGVTAVVLLVAALYVLW